MTRHALAVLVTLSLLSACSPPSDLKEFGDIWVSDPIVEDSQVKVQVFNKTNEPLCYFEDGLFYGPNSIEGGSGETEIGRPGIGAASLREIKLSRTNRYDFRLKRLREGRGEISMEIAGQYPIRSGDDLAFDIVYCNPESDGLHRFVVYSSRLR